MQPKKQTNLLPLRPPIRNKLNNPQSTASSSKPKITRNITQINSSTNLLPRLSTSNSQYGSYSRRHKTETFIKNKNKNTRRKSDFNNHSLPESKSFDEIMMKQKLADQRKLIYAINDIMTEYDKQKFQRI